MGSLRLRCVKDFLRFLTSECISSVQAKGLLFNLSSPQVKAIAEIFHNLFRSQLNLEKGVEKKLKRHKRILQKIGQRQLSLQKRKKLIKRNWFLIWELARQIKNILKRVWG